MTDQEPTAFAIAYAEAERQREQAELRQRLEAVAAARAEWAAHTYDPMPYADAEPDPRVYAGTGIGALYDLPGSEWAESRGLLGDWRIVPGSRRP